MEIITDSLLIQEYQNGNEVALERLIEKNQSDLFNFILYKVLDESLANDIFQDTFMKIIVKLKKGEYKDEGKFILWAKRIAHNLIIDHYRLLSKHKKVSETSYSDDEFSIFDHISEPTENIEDYLISLQINEDLMKMIQLLPDNQKEVVKLRFFDGLSFKEIAEHTDCSINTTLGRVRYAVMNLRKIMEENQIILTR
ncbi:RNA polymerase sigma factor [Riemerella anatipestifer]|uniref:Sigma-70 family RNA polymerase sigma factor n=1 Tax=Riemerella anatipestifer TaxID=34085 RepID=A0AAP6LIW1_RIEAN|nr:sigma-70 family RNA polymerase sigma factor [Riemerella anatipestifer]MBT0548897.1 sigma-70 family RNA polymerase sigma factor [Riemerella anatipestifer]MBT0555211.1 sigma-70 family RNA polymerase sigma factor [Riemerella anatipestifer]MBT0559660.1 sigma-70 family RNA polymerase sigma factor [Riemerella anatipestifer]MCD5968046.1 sigma-70 family RNA polymerase sigma factor [Riemerella anatipestifer]MCO7354765.1 sigma-70 family RNA polymerase sigma factor [Riemerella anatipestifer]